MAKKNNVMKIVAVSIVLLFLVSGFSFMIYGHGSEKSSSLNSTSGNININITPFITPFTQNSSQNNSAGYVKYTLDLLNDTLINGNFLTGKSYLYPLGVA